MTNQTHHEQHAPESAGSPENAGLSLMAVQELLGLFNEHQNHAHHTVTTAGESITDLQAVLQDKPLTYV
jgi:hypothetical protein